MILWRPIEVIGSVIQMDWRDENEVTKIIIKIQGKDVIFIPKDE